MSPNTSGDCNAEVAVGNRGPSRTEIHPSSDRGDPGGTSGAAALPEALTNSQAQSKPGSVAGASDTSVMQNLEKGKGPIEETTEQQSRNTGTPENQKNSPIAPEQASPAQNAEGMGASLARLLECLVEQWTVVEEKVETDAKGEKRVFALLRRRSGKSKGHSFANRFTSNSPGDRYDYESKYPEDPEGEGMAPNARVWRVYLDEAGHFDADMVDNIRDTVDVILVFAGLFSAVVSTLVSQASTALQPDFSEITAALLMELVALQRAMVAGTVVGTVPPSTLNLGSPFTPSNPDRWVNGLWFVSLAFSLSTALLAVLIKQWVQAYVAPTFGTPHFQSRVRHFRYMGMEEWHVPLIAGMLPILLHLSLFLFFVGLIVLLFTLDHTIAGFVTAIGVLAYFAYLGTNLLPVWYSQCPYKTPLSRYAYVTVRTFAPTIRKCLISLQRVMKPATSLVHPLYTACSRHLHQTRSAVLVFSDIYFAETKDIESDPLTQDEQGSSEQAPSTLQLAERASVDAGGDNIDAHIFSWLCDMSSNPSVGLVTAAAVSDLPIGFPIVPNLRNSVLPHACHGFMECLQDAEINPGMEKRAYVYLHAHMQLGPNAPMPSSSSLTTSRRKTFAKDAWCRCHLWWSSQDFSASLFVQQPNFAILDFLQPRDWVVMAILKDGTDSTLWPHALTPHDLRRLQPPTTSKRICLLLLQRGLLEAQDSSASTFDAKRDNATLQSFLASINQSFYDFLCGDPFCVLQNVLLCAYLWEWTRPQDVFLEHHHILRAAIDFDRHTLDRENLERFTRHWFSQQHSGLDAMVNVLTYYQTHIAIHMLLHYARSSFGERDPLFYVVSQIGKESPLLSQLLLTSPYRDDPAQPAVILPPSHPILEQMRNLIPTPAHTRQLIQDWQDFPDQQSSILSTLGAIGQITLFLALNLEPSLSMPIVQANDPLEAFHLWFQAFPGNRHDLYHHYGIGDAIQGIIWSASSCPNIQESLFYVRSHLAHFCAWILSDVASLAIESLPRPPLGLSDGPTPSFEPLKRAAEFIAKHTALSEYELLWDEAIENLPTSLLREEDRPYIELCASWLRPQLAEIWTEVEERRTKAQDKTAAGPSLWSKARSSVRSMLPSFIKRGRQPLAGEDVQMGMTEVASEEDVGRSSKDIPRVDTETRFEEV